MRKPFIILFTLAAICLTIIPSAWGQTPPASYDLRDYNRVTAIKSQSGGTCWTHGTMAALESNLLTTGAWAAAGETGEPDLAEYHLDWWNGFNQHNNDDLDPATGDGLTVHQGGDYRVSSAYITRGEGAVRNIDGQSYSLPPDRYHSSYHYYYVRDIEWFIAQSDLSDIDTIKNVIMTEGALGTCYCSSSSFIINGNIHYQPPDSTLLPNHAVAIIGWDDNKITQAPQPGAWLMKNSWGTGSGGEGGYYWISYYDKWCCQEPEMGAVSFRNVEPMAYDKVYYHDYHGWRDAKTDISEAFNAFIAAGDQQLQAVSFYTTVDNVNYAVKIYDRFTDGQLYDELASKSGIFDVAGFHTVNLNTPVELAGNDDFFVYLYLSQGGHAFDRTSQIPVLLNGSGQEDLTVVKSTAHPGESYYHDGLDWQDLYDFDFTDPDWGTWDQTANFCIKALVVKPLIMELIERPGDWVAPGTVPQVKIKITPASENFVPDTANIWCRYDNGDFTAINMTPEGDDHFTVALPAGDWGDLPQFYFSARGDLGSVVYLPAYAPVDVFSFNIGKERIAYADNFETDTGWESINLGAASGDWQRGIPVNDPAWSYDPYSDSDGSGQCYLTQNELDNTDVDDGAVSLTSPVIDMSFGRITIAYDYFLRLTNTTGGVDHLLVEINSSDGVGPWTVIADHISNGGLAWRHHEIDAHTLDSLGINLTSNMRLRFTANDADTQSIVEAGLDAVVITSTRTTRPGDTDGDNDLDLVDFAKFAAYWLKSDCTLCGGADLIDDDGKVGIRDFDIFVRNWLKGK